MANDELRTWNPGVDGENGSILDVQKLPADRFGTSGYQITVSVSNILRITPDTRVCKDKTALQIVDLEPNNIIQFNKTAELPGRPAYATDLWLIVDSRAGK